MFISVIIPTFNRVETLKKCLQHLALQTLPPENFEIIIVDDFSSDETPQFCASYVEFHPNVRAIRNKKNLGLATTRNEGIRVAKGDLFVFLDNDLLAAPDYLEKLSAEYSKYPNEMVAVMSNITYPPEVLAKTNFGTFIQSRAIGYRSPRDMVGIDITDLPSNYFAGGGSSVKREHIEKVGLFDEDLKKYGSEDELFGYRFKKGGGRICFCESAKIIHDDKNVLPKYWRTKYRELGRYSLRTLAEKEADLIRNSLYQFLMPVDKNDSLATKFKKNAITLASLAPVRVPVEWFVSSSDSCRALRFPLLYRYLTVAWMKNGFLSTKKIDEVTY